MSKQTSTISDLSDLEKSQLSDTAATKERLYQLSGENRGLQDRVAEMERRVLDCDQQNRDLITIAGKKEEVTAVQWNSLISHLGFVHKMVANTGSC